VRTIAKRLNDDGRVSPRPQQGRPAGWAPSSVWAVLRRPLYNGEVVWNRSQKRDRWGIKAQVGRDEQTWVRVPDPKLRIVPETLWLAVDSRATAARATYLKATSGTVWGRPVNAHESNFLLTGFITCGNCGASMLVRSRHHGRRRSFRYACSAFH